MGVLCIGVHRVPRLLDCPGQSEFKGPSRVVDTIATIFGDYARTSELSHRDDDGFKASSQARGATGVREGGASSGRRNDGAHYSSLVADPDSFDFRSSPERGSRSQRRTGQHSSIWASQAAGGRRPPGRGGVERSVVGDGWVCVLRFSARGAGCRR